MEILSDVLRAIRLSGALFFDVEAKSTWVAETPAMPKIASLVMPGLLVGFGIGLSFKFLGIGTSLFSSALGAQLTWTLPFGLLIMFAGSAPYVYGLDRFLLPRLKTAYSDRRARGLHRPIPLAH